MPADEERLPRTRTDHTAALVLARVIADGSPAAMRDAMRTVDPLDRSRIRRRVQRALDDAVSAAPHGDLVHTQRLAYLDLVGEYVGLEESGDVEHVRARFEALPKPPARPSWRTSIVTVLVITIAGIAAALFFVLRPVPFADLHPGEGGRADAYRRGGIPRHDETKDLIFREMLPELIVAASRVRFHGAPYQAEADAAVRRLGGEDVRAALPSAVYTRLTALVRTYASWGREAGEVDGIVRVVEALDAALMQAGLGYFVDALHVPGDERGPNVVVATFRVDRVGLYQSGSHTERVLFVNRLDRLNVRQGALGYTRVASNVALVLVDAIDGHLVEVLLPLLGEDPTPTLVAPGTTVAARPWLGPVHARAADIVRRQLVDDTRREEVFEIARLLERRRVLHHQLMERTVRAGFVLSTPNRYDFVQEGLDRIVPSPPELGEFERIRSTLGERDNVRAFVALRTRLEAMIAWHDVAFLIDRHGPALPAPRSLLALLDQDGTAPPGRFDGGLATRQLSAYLAMIARSPEMAGLALTLVVRLVIDDRENGSADEDAAWVLIPELARTLRMGDGREPIMLRASDIGALYTSLSRVPSARLAAAAKTTWARLYGRPFPSARVVP